MKNKFLTVSAVFVGLILYVAAPAFLFVYFSVPYPAGIALAAFGAVCLIVCAVADAVLAKRNMKKFLETPLDTYYNRLENHREQILNEFEKETAKLDRLLRKAFLYNLFLAFSCLCVSCGVVILMRAFVPLSEDLPLMGLIAIAFMVCAFLYIFYLPVLATLYRKPPRRIAGRNAQFALDRKEYPLFYAIADRCAKAVGFAGKFYLLLDDGDGISISQEDGTVFVCLSPTLAPLLTEEELQAVLVHEFAHVVHADTARTEKYKTAVYRYSERKIFGKYANLFFSYFGDVIKDEIENIQCYSSTVCEQNADEEVKRHADAQAFLDATAKSYLFSEVFREPIVEFSYGVYAAETPPDDFYKQKIEYFKEHAQEVYPHALEIMMRRLPARTDSHPTFAMRAAAFGITQFDPFQYPEGDFLAEALRYTAACDRELTHFLTLQWKQLREDRYEDVQENTERYESAPDRANEAVRLIALSDYFGTDYEKALPLADKMLQEDADCNCARFYKGMILCTRDDESGLPLLKKAICRDYELIDSLDLYGECVLRTGKQELLDEMRATQTPFVQEILDGVKKRMKKSYFKINRSTLTACPQNEQTEKIIRSVEDLVQITMKEIYLCGGKEFNGIKRYYLFAPYPADERCGKIAYRLQRYFSLIKNKDEDYIIRFCKPNEAIYRHAKTLGVKIA